MKIAILTVACLTAMSLVWLYVQHCVNRRKEIRAIEAESGIPHKKQSAGQWLKAHMPSRRRIIQVYTALLYNANIKGYISGTIYKSETTKYMCVPGLNCYSCPGAVGACPLGSFQNSLAGSKVRTPYYIFGILGLFGLAFARTVCGFLCPVGLGQELLYKVRTPKLKKSRVTRSLSYFKYVLLVVLAIALPLMYAVRDIAFPAFCKYVCPAGTFGGAIGLLAHPSNASLFESLGALFTWKFVLLIVFMVGSVFIFRFFCRFFCPLGAIYGFFNRIALLGVQVDYDNCIDCGKCIAVCKMDTKKVGDRECIQCGECISVCPTNAISWKGSKIFLRKSEIDTAPVIKAPDMSVAPATVALDTTAAAVNVASFGDAAVAQAGTDEQTAPVITARTEESAGADAPTQAATPPRKKKSAKFWAQLAAYVTALAVLIVALVYYNAIDVKPARKNGEHAGVVGFEVGQTAPDFTVETYNADGNFTLYDDLGKITVINFWATWCTWCVKEMPDFNTLAVNRSDVNVLAVHVKPTEDVRAYIARKGWSDYAVTFAQDNIDADGYSVLFDWASNGKDGLPQTVILDAEGKVLYNKKYEFKNYEDLEQTVSSLI